MTLTVFVPGEPAPQGSKKHVGRGIMVEASKKLAPWRKQVASVVGSAYTGELVEGPVSGSLTFVMPRPKYLAKKATPLHIKRPDVDKLTRAVLDGITGVYLKDDSQAYKLLVEKRTAELDEEPGVHITLKETI
ncbi:RusA-like Holliday junction resolvase [Gordonia phage Syleon]|uniref:RusA-like resolvase n=2 Tax=Octobienvirus TaxID=3044779 RepID=A0AAE9C2D3_9CAUD|nr:RusA-like Holliday junction resolvase [Gordonia phage Kudefre]YP_010246745.1 RusA-like Holliday junction resolvase [Gordonia phage Syleon]QGH75815.1 RusA-like resolvase [Gordonia phage Syleon]UDL15309.1 RusA-like resolvase [Gordonia phage Kudefre]